MLPFEKDFDWTMHGWSILARTTSQLHAWCLFGFCILSESKLANKISPLQSERSIRARHPWLHLVFYKYCTLFSHSSML
jgi:hypothetical protein